MSKSKSCQWNPWLRINLRGFCLVGKSCKLYLNAANVPLNSAKVLTFVNPRQGLFFHFKVQKR